MKLANTPFNFDKIQQNDRVTYYDFIAELFRPYNVNIRSLRIQIVSLHVLEIITTRVMLSAKTF